MWRPRRSTLNEIGVCNLELDSPIAFTTYAENRHLGSFIIIDRFTNSTVGMGLIHFALRRASNIHWQAVDVNKVARASQAKQKPTVLWFTGLSGSGKSTIANLVEKKLHASGHMTYLLDGDNVRHGLNRDLGFTDADRVENIRRVAEVSKLMVDAGLIVLVSFISPFRAERLMARESVEKGEFVEIFVEHHAGRSRKARREGPLCQGAARRDQELHRHFIGLRNPGKSRTFTGYGKTLGRTGRRDNRRLSGKTETPDQGLSLATDLLSLGFSESERARMMSHRVSRLALPANLLQCLSGSGILTVRRRVVQGKSGKKRVHFNLSSRY